MAALARCAQERGQAAPEMAEQLGYSYPYINLLISGARRVDQVSGISSTRVRPTSGCRKLQC
jgi:hypothetical protein